MASSSSAKKVARIAASSGPSNPSKKKNWIFPVAIVAIVATGIGAVAYARSQNAELGDNSVKPRAALSEGSPSDHWHAAFAINVCGKELPPLEDAQADVLGIHTHGDGLAHVHPFSTRASGKRATLSRFFDQTGTTVTDDGFKLANGKVYKTGVTTCGDKPAEVVMAYWSDALTATTSKPTKIVTSGFGDLRFSNDKSAFTLAVVPKGERDIPPPKSAANIEQLSANDTNPTAGAGTNTGTSGTGTSGTGTSGTGSSGSGSSGSGG